MEAESRGMRHAIRLEVLHGRIAKARAAIQSTQAKQFVNWWTAELPSDSAALG